MALELHRERFAVIALDTEGETLELEWLEATQDMTDDDFMRVMQRFADLAEAHRPPNLLVDVTKFGHSPGEEVGPWRDERIIPTYNAAGVQRFAFLLPAGAPSAGAAGAAKEPPGEFPTAYFADRQEVLDWFRG